MSKQVKIKKKKIKKKKTAEVVCRDGKRFWTTQNQFWQWIREGVIRQTGDKPLTGCYIKENEEYAVVISNTVLNLVHPNHLREALTSRRIGVSGH